MSPLRKALGDYLSVRRALGSRLDRAEKLLGQFVTYLEQHQASTVTIEYALAWATAPAEADPWWWAMRLSPVRGFAAYLRSLDGRAEVPPPGLIAHGRHRATPYLYSESDVQALMRAATGLPRRVNAATYQAMIGLLAATGMRVGEAIALDTGDFDPHQGMVTVRAGKFSKQRLLPLHPTTTDALGRYLDTRSRLLPNPTSAALFISSVGTRMSYNPVHRTFRHLVRQSGLATRPATSPGRIHDLRHSHAVNTLLDWYSRGEDVQAQLPRLSTYLGHADPKDTFWYLSAAPELLALACDRLETHRGGHT